MNLKIAICDDDLEIHSMFRTYFTQYKISSDFDFTVDYYYTGNDLLNAYPMERNYDIIFLDIEMPYKNGIDTASEIRRLPDRNVIIIFLTTYPAYMKDSFQVHAYQYITKPMSYTVFFEQMNSITAEIMEAETTIVLLDSDNCSECVNLNDIISIQTETIFNKNTTLSFYTTSQVYHCKGKFGDWEKQLSAHYFACTHRGILVNLRYIKRFLTDSVELTNGMRLALSRRKNKEIRSMFSKYLLIMKYRR